MALRGHCGLQLPRRAGDLPLSGFTTGARRGSLSPAHHLAQGVRALLLVDLPRRLPAADLFRLRPVRAGRAVWCRCPDVDHAAHRLGTDQLASWHLGWEDGRPLRGKAVVDDWLLPAPDGLSRLCALPEYLAALSDVPWLQLPVPLLYRHHHLSAKDLSARGSGPEPGHGGLAGPPDRHCGAGRRRRALAATGLPISLPLRHRLHCYLAVADAEDRHPETTHRRSSAPSVNAPRGGRGDDCRCRSAPLRQWLRRQPGGNARAGA